VASIVVPGARWNAMGTPDAVELKLSRFSDVTESWGGGTAAEMISKVRSLHSQEKALLLSDSKDSGAGLFGNAESGQSGVQGISGVVATRHLTSSALRMKSATAVTSWRLSMLCSPPRARSSCSRLSRRS
jgi:hypothetical protein